eukprot:gnl/TRDRNA2_/TRDRNA2_148383_c3_seq1.p1 gnl/TRDRNA2_/TRDRNA2_148383_c3~~gnl/TRDRNA2_/TRDRNA2_148383_c3_seq1.p1  ORF type:complete len:553 (-),score=86.66 gnl/TRDRNA2_/TRDRNA2_148383_c3_seq1:64-1662(-)
MYRAPYPTCEPDLCSEPPDTTQVDHFMELYAPTSTGGVDCYNLTSDYRMASSGLCVMKCEPGWTSLGDGFLCYEGQFTAGKCSKQSCPGSGLPIKYGKVECESALFLDGCRIKCNPGFYKNPRSGAKKDVNALCDTSETHAEAVPALVVEDGTDPDELCQMIYCPNPREPNGRFPQASGEGTSAVWVLKCNTGFMVNALIGASAYCDHEGNLKQPLPYCEPTPTCDGHMKWSAVHNAEGSDCGKAMVDKEKCKVICRDQYIAVGEFMCSSGIIVGMSVCVIAGSDDEVTVREVTMIASTIRMGLDLLSMNMLQADGMIRAAIVTSFNITYDDITALEIVQAEQPRRRLRMLNAPGEVERRRAQEEAPSAVGVKPVDIAYEIIVPEDGRGEDFFLQKASELGLDGSFIQQTFLRKLLIGYGIIVTDIDLVVAPRTYKVTLAQTITGAIVTPGPSTATTTPEPVETTTEPEDVVAPTQQGEEEVSLEVFFGALAGTMVGLICCTVICCYLLRRYVRSKLDEVTLAELSEISDQD